MENVLQIFSRVAEKEGVKIGTLERTIGASKGVISRALKNNTDVQSKWLLALIEKYPQYDYQKMLMGEFSTSPDHDEDEKRSEVGEPEVSNGDIKAMHADIKHDLKMLAEGVTSNFETLSRGVMQGLKDQQKVLKFINQLNVEEIKKATGDLNDFLKERKE